MWVKRVKKGVWWSGFSSEGSIRKNGFIEGNMLGNDNCVYMKSKALISFVLGGIAKEYEDNRDNQKPKDDYIKASYWTIFDTKKYFRGW